MANSCSAPLTVSARFDRTLIRRASGSRRYLVVEVSVGPAFTRAGQAPLNLGIAIDASGSMAGPRLEAARKAVAGVVQMLGPEDALSVVSFSSDVVTHLKAARMDAASREAVETEMGGLRIRDTTNLSSGWLKAAEHVELEGLERPTCHSRVLVLSDGQSNQGILRPDELSLQAAEFCDRGIFTSAVGIGGDYSTKQLRAISDHGGGRLHHADRPTEIVEVVLGELREARSASVENVRVYVEFPAGLEPHCWNSYPTLPAGATGIRASLGAISAGSKKDIIFAVSCPEGPSGEELVFGVRVVWRNIGRSEGDQESEARLVLARVSDEENRTQPWNSKIALRIAELYQAKIIEQAVELNRQKDQRCLQDLLERRVREFARFIDGVPGANPLLEDLRKLAARAGVEWTERARKHIQMDAYISTHSVPDHRSTYRPHWTSYLDEN